VEIFSKTRRAWPCKITKKPHYLCCVCIFHKWLSGKDNLNNQLQSSWCLSKSKKRYSNFNIRGLHGLFLNEQGMQFERDGKRAFWNEACGMKKWTFFGTASLCEWSEGGRRRKREEWARLMLTVSAGVAHLFVCSGEESNGWVYWGGLV